MAARDETARLEPALAEGQGAAPPAPITSGGRAREGIGIASARPEHETDSAILAQFKAGSRSELQVL